MRTNSSHTSTSELFEFSFIYYENSGTHIVLLKSYARILIYHMKIRTSHVMGTSHKRYESSYLVLLDEASVSARTLIFIIF